MTRDEKIIAIQQHVIDLRDLAISYSLCARISDRLPDELIDAMYRQCVEENKLHEVFANERKAKKAAP